MKDLIRKILKESELEDEFDWVPKETSLAFGSKFSESDVCGTHNDINCKIDFDGEKFTFYLDFNDWASDFANVDEHDEYYLQQAMIGSNIYDYYEVDEEEFNYIHHHLTAENKEKLKYLIGVLQLDTKLEDYMKSQNKNLSDLFNEFNPIKDGDYVLNDVLGEISSAIVRNRQTELDNEYTHKLKSSGLSIDLDRRDSLKIQMPSERVFNEMGNGSDLTTILTKASEWFELGWSEFYWDSYNTEGASEGINRVVGDYLDDVIEITESNIDFIEYNKFLDLLKKMNFKKISNKSWSKQFDDSDSIINFGVTNISRLHGTFKLTTSVYKFDGPIKRYEDTLLFDELPTFASNYRLDL
jgi:hypothetical protein